MGKYYQETYFGNGGKMASFPVAYGDEAVFFNSELRLVSSCVILVEIKKEIRGIGNIKSNFVGVFVGLAPSF